MEKVTLRTLAERLGLGKSTVQRALAGSALVDERTRARVLAEAESVGYKHDAYFAALSAKRRRGAQGNGSALLLHYLHKSETEQMKRVGLVLAEELAAEGQRMGFEVKRVSLQSEEPEQALIRRLWQQGSSGFLLGYSDAALQQAVAAFGKVPVLCCQRQDYVPFHTVRFAVNDSMRLAWQHLWEQGSRRIGCAVMRHPQKHHDDDDRLGAALALIKEHSEVKRPVMPLQCLITDSDAFVTWLHKERPDGVISFSAGRWYEHQEAGFGNVPFVTLHAKDLPELRHVPGVREPHELLVKELLVRMDSMIRHGEVGLPRVPVHSVISPEWWDGT